MAKVCKLMGLALLGLAAWCGTAGAQVIIRVPFVNVDVIGPNVSVRAPFVNVDVRGLPLPPPLPLPGVYVGPFPPRMVPPVLVPGRIVEVTPDRPMKPIEVPTASTKARRCFRFRDQVLARCRQAHRHPGPPRDRRDGDGAVHAAGGLPQGELRRQQKSGLRLRRERGRSSVHDQRRRQGRLPRLNHAKTWVNGRPSARRKGRSV